MIVNVNWSGDAFVNEFCGEGLYIYELEASLTIILRPMYRIIKLGIFLSFLICYVHLGHDGSAFVAEIEFSLIKYAADIFNLIQNPYFLIGFPAQVLLVIAIFRNKPSSA